ncbi:MAG: DUF4382 domain-containing protein [Sulfuricaulis sp.]|uniref:DUF4382 domain-containing protein n=1 Tax=Sulfuricaulis sp. TaxID=2003553 RepID=UPI003C55E83C
MNTSSILKTYSSLVIFSTILAVSSCGGSGGGGSSGAGTGTLSLQITDGPVETADNVLIQFSGLEIQAADGKRTTLYYCQDPADATKTVLSDTACTTPPATKQLDLLALSGGQTDFLLDSFTLPSGHYSWIRLMVDTADPLDSYIVVSGTPHELTIPSGMQTGMKLNRGFDVPAGGSADFTIDFDLRKSVHMTGTGDYMLRPTLRMVDNIMAGSISGTVDALLVPGGCTPAVYVFEGSGVTPDDIDGIAADPVSTASVKLDISDGIYKYKAAFLEAGSYSIAYICDAAADDPTVDNALTFSGTTTVSVTAKTNTVLNF